MEKMWKGKWLGENEDMREEWRKCGGESGKEKRGRDIWTK